MCAKGVGAHLLVLQRRAADGRSLDVERDAAFDRITAHAPAGDGREHRTGRVDTPFGEPSFQHAGGLASEGNPPLLAALSQHMEVCSAAEAHVRTGERRQL